MTPLMFAAHQGQPATAQLLVERGCNVDRRSTDGETALEAAIWHSQGDGELVAIIGNRTTVRLAQSLMLLAASKVVISDKLGPLVRRMAAEDTDALLGGLRLSAEHGNSKLLKMLMGEDRNNAAARSILDELLDNAVMSDSWETVELLMPIVDKHGVKRASKNFLQHAVNRGNRRIIGMLHERFTMPE